MTSLRAQLLLGIVAANVTALSALAYVVKRDIDRRNEKEVERREIYRKEIVSRVNDVFDRFLGEFDFNELDSNTDQSPGFFRRVLDQRHWELVRDAVIVQTPTISGENEFAGKIELNPLGAPDEESERMREGALRLMGEAYASGRAIQREKDDVVVIPLYSGGDGSRLRRLRGAVDSLVRSSRVLLATNPGEQPTSSDRTALRFFLDDLEREMVSPTRDRDLWGAAYIRVNVPQQPTVDSGIDVTVIALAIGGATVLAIALLWLLLRRLVLEPLERVSGAAVAVAGGSLDSKLAPTGDSPEIDALIANFNRMTRELTDSRGALERRVDDALAKARASEKGLVLNERLAAMGTLASGVAHEINNPLGGMLNAIATLKRKGAKDDLTTRYLGLLEDGLSRVRDVVARVLRFSPSRTRTGPVSLARVIDDAARFVMHRVRDRGAVLEVAVPDDLRVDGDGAALGQVFLNLLQNALDALESPGASGPTGADAPLEPGPKRITVSGRAEGDTAVIEVADTGCGMEPEQVTRAFDLFYTTKASGTGLGLSIVHQIIAEHRGSITVTSELGVGTRFEIRILRAAPESSL